LHRLLAKDPGDWHLTHGCPVLASRDWVVKYDPSAAKTIEHKKEMVVEVMVEMSVVVEMVVAAADTTMQIGCLRMLHLLLQRRLQLVRRLLVTIACSTLPIVLLLLARLQGGLISIMMYSTILTQRTVMMMVTL
jgi:hypothetical protein